MDKSGKTNSERLAEKLCWCLEDFFHEVAPRKHEVQVTVEMREWVHDPGGKGVTRALVLHLLGSTFQMRGRLTVKHFGGNVYDVTMSLARVGEKTFSLCVPDLSVSAKAMRAGTETMCRHVLEEIEREIGRRFLRAAAKAPNWTL